MEKIGVQILGVKAVYIALFAYLCMFAEISKGQSLRYPLSAGYIRVGNYSKNFIDPLSCRFNQAALAGIQSMSAAVYGEKRYGLQELGLYYASVCFPVRFGGIGISANYFGHSNYNETQLGIAYGKKLGRIDVGIQVSSQSIRSAGYGKDRLLTIEGGMIIHLNEQLLAGLHVFNPNGSKFGVDHLEKLSSIFAAGLGFEPSKLLFLSGEIIKETGKPVNINLGLQYLFSKRVGFRIGVYTESPAFYFGPGINWKSLRLNITASYHPQLGLSPGILLVFENEDEEE